MRNALLLLTFITLSTLPVSAAPHHHSQKRHRPTLHGQTQPQKLKMVPKLIIPSVAMIPGPIVPPVTILPQLIIPSVTMTSESLVPPITIMPRIGISVSIMMASPITNPNTSHGIPPKGAN